MTGILLLYGEQNGEKHTNEEEASRRDLTDIEKILFGRNRQNKYKHRTIVVYGK